MGTAFSKYPGLMGYSGIEKLDVSFPGREDVTRLKGSMAFEYPGPSFAAGQGPE